MGEAMTIIKGKDLVERRQLTISRRKEISEKVG